MSVIQSIRDKYARWAVVAIALSLLGFIMMDAFAGKGSLFGNRSTTVGKVNGKTIEYHDFAKKVEAAERMQKDQGYNVGDMGRQQIVEGVWDQEITDVVLEKQYDELGLTVTEKELRDMLYGNNPPADLKQRFSDPNTGVYNAVEAQQFIGQIKKQGTEQDQDQLNNYLASLEDQRLMTKYTALLSSSMYFPKWFLEKRNVDNSMIANLSYVAVPYTSLPDSSVTVTDADIQNYINDHKKDFQQKQETRSISYVTFSAAPNAADSAATLNTLEELKTQFDTAKDYTRFLARNSAMPFYDGLISKKDIQQPNKDSILNAPVGVVYGPYLDAGQQANYVLSKILEARQVPDTVKIRHVLVATQQQTPTGDFVPVREDAVAKKIIDSVQMLLKSGVSFDSLVNKYSDDPGSKATGGVYDNVTTGRMVPAFNDFIFTHKTGETGIVKTDYGYHFVEILSQKGSSPAYKIAYLAKPIVASQETENNAQNAASLFAGDSRNASSFNENWEKNLREKGINKLSATDIKPMDYSVQGMNGASRSFVKSIFEASKGDVIGPERVGDSYVVALVTDVNEAGLASVNAARPIVEPILRNRKKAEQIKKNLGQFTSLEQVATKTGQQVQHADSLHFSGANNMLGYEPKVIGAAFNPANKGKVSEAIDGQTGVFVLQVISTSTIPVASASIEEQRKMLEEQNRQRLMSQMQYGGGNPFLEPLKESAKVKDYRAKFY